MSGDAQDMHRPGLDLHHDQHVQALQQHDVNVQEVAGRMPGPWAAGNCRQVGEPAAARDRGGRRPGPGGSSPPPPGVPGRAAHPGYAGSLWGANTPSWRLTCDVLSQPNCHVASALAITEGLGSPKKTQQDHRGSTNGQYENYGRCGP
jgi:hypothetical protein